MADFATLVMGAETSGLLKGKDALQQVTAAGAKTDAAVTAVTTSFKKAGAEATAAATQTQQLINQMTGVATATDKATRANEQWWTSAMRQRDAYQQLRSSLDPLYAASKRYEMAQEQVNEALRAGVITQQEAARTMQMAERAFLSTGNAAQVMGNKVKSASSHTTNLMFQFQDISMMLAAGQNPLMLAMQQGTQVSGVFKQMRDAGLSAFEGIKGGLLAMLSPMSLLTIGAIAGGAALVQWGVGAWSANSKAKELEKSMDALADSADAFMKASDTARQSAADLAKEFGSSADEALRTLEILQGIALEKTMDSLRVSFEQLDLSGFQNAVDIFKEGKRELESLNDTYNKAVSRLQEGLKMTGDQAARFLDIVKEVKNSGDLASVVRSTDEMNKFLIETFGSAQKIPPELREMVDALTTAQLTAARIKARMDESGKSAEDAALKAGGLASALSVAAQEALKIASALSVAPKGIEGLETKADALRAQIAALDSGQTQAAASAAGLRVELEKKYGLTTAANAAEEAYITGIINREVAAYESVESLNKALGDRVKALNKAENAAGRAGAKLEKNAATIRASLGPLDAYNKKLLELVKVQNLLSDKEMAKAITDLNVELADNIPIIGDVADAFSTFLVNGAKDFDSFKDTVLNSFKSMLAQMIATALKNQIVIGLGLGVSPGAAAGGVVASGVLGGGGGSGILGGLGLSKLLGGGGGGGFLSGIGQGIAGVFSGGGIGSSFANLGGLLTGQVSGMGAIGAALPALGIVLGGIAVLAKGLSREYKGTALRGTLGTSGFEGTQFDFYKGGFLRSNKATYSAVPDAIQAMLDDSMKGVTQNLKDMSKALNLSSAAIKDFTAEEFTLWINGKSQEEIQQALMDIVDDTSASMAELVLTTDKWSKTGETAYDTMVRLSSSLITVNNTFKALGHTLYQGSLAGADAASNLVDFFGSLEQFNAVTTTYFQAFYSEQEQRQAAIRQMRSEFRELGLAMPKTREAFRLLVEGVDISTEGGRRLYAELLNLAAGMNQILPQVAGLSNAMLGVAERIGGTIGAMIDQSRDSITAAKQAAQAWYKTSATMRSFVDDLLGTKLSAASTPQVRARTKMLYEQAYSGTLAGDSVAAGELTKRAKDYLESAMAGASTGLEYRRIAAAVQAQVSFAAGVADLEGGNQDVLATLYQQQIDVLTDLASFLSLDGLTGDAVASLDEGVRALLENWDGTIDSFETALEGLEDAITQTRNFSFENLAGSLDLLIDLSPDTPDWVRDLVNTAGGALQTSLDFIIRRNDLTPDLRWIAAHELSNHIANVQFAITGPSVDRELLEAAVLSTKTVTRRIRAMLVGGSDAMDLVKVLNKLSGEGGNQVHLNGSVSFSPNREFQVWYGDRTRNLIRNPMVKLGNQIDRLREMMEQVQRDTQAAAISTTGIEASYNLEASKTAQAERGAELERLFAQYGIVEKFASGGTYGYVNGNYELLPGTQTPGQGADFDVVNGVLKSTDSQWASSSGWDGIMNALREKYGVTGSTLAELVSKITAQVNDPVAADAARLESLRQQVRDLGGVPAFASGTDFAPGGLSMVGEFGRELVQLPRGSKVYNRSRSSQMMSNEDLLSELQRLREEVSGLRDESASSQNRLAYYLKLLSDLADKHDSFGAPVSIVDQTIPVVTT